MTNPDVLQSVPSAGTGLHQGPDVSDGAVAVELIPIESQTKTIQTCFRQCLYEVPSFQRPYSWSTDQLNEYWNDVVLAQSDFFFGSIVTWVSEKRDLFNDTYSIIDGQQRITTSAIMLSVIRDAFRDIADVSEACGDDSTAAKAQAATTQGYLIVEDDDGNSHPVLKRPEPMFYSNVLNPDSIHPIEEWNTSATRIGEARHLLRERVVDDLKNRPLADRVERLKSIRANVLKARVIQVELASEEDGFLIFETLNTRGTDLRLSDLAKNLLIRGGATESVDRDTIATRWDKVVDGIRDIGLASDVADRFIWQSWNSRRTAVKESELFKAISAKVGSESGAHMHYLEELEEDARNYVMLDDEDVRSRQRIGDIKDAFAVAEFVDSVRALAIFGVSVAHSTILAIARKYRTTTLVSQKQLIHVGKLVENFHFQYNALTNSGSTGGTRTRYNRFAVQLEQARTKAEVNDAIVDLQRKLKESLPSRERTTEAFRSQFYAPKLGLNRAQRKQASTLRMAYVLMAFSKHHKLLPAGQNLRTWSIDHITPQSKGPEDHRDPVYSIGNLALISPSINSELNDKPLSVKLPILKRGHAYFDEELEAWYVDDVTVPTALQIANRARLLADEAVDAIWSIR